jgi:hypothetical protein
MLGCNNQLEDGRRREGGQGMTREWDRDWERERRREVKMG